jgi:hypothetical protein
MSSLRLVEKNRGFGSCEPIPPLRPTQLNGRSRSHGNGHFVLSAAVLVSILSMFSCVDLSSVVQFAKCSQDVGNSFKSLTDETLATCKRARDFSRSGKTPLECTQYENIKPKLTAINDALFDYIASLGKLAAPVSDTNPFKDVASDLKKADPSISPTDQTEATAAGGLFSALGQVAFSGYQQRRLTTIVRDTNGSVQSVVAFLSGYAADQSAEMIRNTWTLENEFCVGQSQVESGERLATKLLRLMCDEDAARKEAKLAAIKKYQDALKVVADTHTKLSDPKNWNTKELAKYLVPQSAQLTAAALSMRKAFQ